MTELPQDNRDQENPSHWSNLRFMTADRLIQIIISKVYLGMDFCGSRSPSDRRMTATAPFVDKVPPGYSSKLVEFEIYRSTG
jgi:hypothetical protein